MGKVKVKFEELNRQKQGYGDADCTHQTICGTQRVVLEGLEAVQRGGGAKKGSGFRFAQGPAHSQPCLHWYAKP